MRAVCRFALAVALTCLAAPAMGAPAGRAAREGPAGRGPEAGTETGTEAGRAAASKYEETLVVSASRTEEKLINAPATMTVIGPQTIQSAPTQNFAELLRAVPGMNITQVSARDINVTSRGATGTLATGQLALLDGRSLYQDFFGFVMWDFLPVNLNEIKQVEVIRGPASAVWGANALNGVVNVITKSPREMQGTSAMSASAASIAVRRDRHDSRAPGRCSTSAARTRRRSTIAWRSSSRPAATRRIRTARPTGQIPCDRPEVCTVTTNAIRRSRTRARTQPKFDGARRLRLSPDGKKLVVLGRRRRHRRHHAHRASARSTSTAARSWATAR